MTVTTAAEPATTTPVGGPRGGALRRWRLIAVILAVALVLALAAAVVLAMRVAAQADAQAALLADQTVTKTYQELERQALLPAAQRSTDALEWAIATPQSDTTATVWTTEVLSSNLSGDTLTARVATSITSAADQPASHYLEFVAQVTPGGTGDVNSTVATCVIRSGSPSSPFATSTVRFTPHMVMEPCSTDLLRRLGITA
jgi:uncharacterized membrane protein